MYARPSKILIIDDDVELVTLLVDYFTLEGFEATPAHSGTEGLQALENKEFDLIILDVMMPGISGVETLQRIREKWRTPVLMLTARGDPVDRILGLELGADDYIAKPFDMLALMVRMEKVLRRSGKFREVYHFRDLTLDNGNRRLSRSGEEIPLPPLEFDVLAVLMKNKNRTVSRERILNEIWGQDYFGDIRTVDVRIANLRKKLNLSEEIRTISKAGYRLEER